MLHKTYAPMLVAATAFVIHSCAPPPSSAPTPPPATTTPAMGGSVAPELTRVEGYADSLAITWLTHRSRHDLIRGFNVYVSRSPGLSGLAATDLRLDSSLYNHATYPGDTEGEIKSESITITPVDMGTKYYVHVRTAYPDGHLGPASPEGEVIARPQGTLTLHLRLSGEPDGFCFEANRPVSSMSDSNDVYLLPTRQGVCLGSPSRLNPLLRTTGFVDLGPSTSLADYPSYVPTDLGVRTIPVRIGNSCVLLLAKHRMAKMRPRQVHGQGDSLYVVFEYVYQPVSGETRF